MPKDEKLGTCEPAVSVIKFFGGLERTAEIAGCSTGWVRRWTKSKQHDRYATGGLIPPKWHPPLIRFAEENGLNFDRAMLVQYAPPVAA